MKELEHEPDLLAAQPSQAVLAKSRDVHAVDQDVTGGWRVETRNEAEQRGLAAAGRADDRDELSARNLE